MPPSLQCTIYKTLADNKDVWAYDKRFHTSLEESLKVPPIPLPPTFQASGAAGGVGLKHVERVKRFGFAKGSGPGGVPPAMQARAHF